MIQLSIYTTQNRKENSMTKQIPDNLLEKYRYGENNPLIDVLEDFIKTSENGILELSTPPGSAKSFSTQEVAKNLLSLEFSQTSHPIDHHLRFIFCVHVNTLMTQVTSFSLFRRPTICLPYEQNSGSQQRFFADVRIKLNFNSIKIKY